MKIVLAVVGALLLFASASRADRATIYDVPASGPATIDARFTTTPETGCFNLDHYGMQIYATKPVITSMTGSFDRESMTFPPFPNEDFRFDKYWWDYDGGGVKIWGGNLNGEYLWGSITAVPVSSPEPATFLLLPLGFIGLAALKLRGSLP